MAKGGAVLAGLRAAQSSAQAPTLQPLGGSVSPLAAQYGQWTLGRTIQSTALPRDPIEFLTGAFGPLTPVQPVGIDTPPPDAERPEPRRWQYPVGWNMPTGMPGTEGLKLADFQTLRTYSEIYSIARACIQLRKDEMLGIGWDIGPTADAAKAMRGNSATMADFGSRRAEAIKFFSRPDPNYNDFTSWFAAVLEDMFVIDALSLYLHPSRITGKGLFGTELAGLDLIDGSLVRPLLDLRGGSPSPPNPAYQVYNFGIPRVDLMTMLAGDDIKELGAPAEQYRGDQLLYLPRNPRSWTPYGQSPLERCIIPVITGLRKQQFNMDYYLEGCHDSATEVLTDNGWKPFEKLAETDRVATRSPDGAFEWQQPTERQRYWHAGLMVAFRSKMTDLLVTPNHRMYVRRMQQKNGWSQYHDWHFREASYFAGRPSAQFRLPQTAHWKGGNEPDFTIPGCKANRSHPARERAVKWLTERLQDEWTPSAAVNADASAYGIGVNALAWARHALGVESQFRGGRGLPCWWEMSRPQREHVPEATGPYQPQTEVRVPMVAFCRMLGMFLSEGWVRKDRDNLFIAQLETSRHFEMMEEALNATGLSWRYERANQRFEINSNALARWFREQCGVYAHNKHVPPGFKDLSADCLAALLEGLMAGDGHTGPLGQRFYTTVSPQLADDVQEIMQKLGINARLDSCRPLSERYEYAKSKRPYYVVRERLSPDCLLPKAKTEEYQGYVYCVTVPNGVVLTRRNGLPAWTGNSIPGVYISPGDVNMTPNQIREVQDSLNAIAGDVAYKHKVLMLPANSKVDPQKPPELADQSDEIIMTQVCMAYNIMPMELGISPRVSATQCYAEGTEVLTRNGWKTFERVRTGSGGDEFATRNPKTHEFEWQHATGYYEGAFDGDLVTFTSNDCVLRVTPDHRMLLRWQDSRASGGKTGEFFKLAGDIRSQKVVTPATSTWRGHGPQSVRFGKYEWAAEDFAAFLGAWLAEGSIGRQYNKLRRCTTKEIQITQREFSKGFEPYRDLLTRMLGRTPGYRPHSGQFFFSCAELWEFLGELGKAADKHVPADIKDWATPALEQLLHHYLLGDGWQEGEAGRWRAKTVSFALAGDLVEIAQKLGMSASVSTQQPKGRVMEDGRIIRAEDCQVNYLLGFRKGQNKALTVGREPYSGKVRCVSVPNQVLYVRTPEANRTITPLWCGNSTGAANQMAKACYTDDVEVLTRRGWLPFAEVHTGDEFATRNPKTQAFEWQKATARQEYDHDGEIVEFTSTHGRQPEHEGLHLRVTPNHRMVTVEPIAKSKPVSYKEFVREAATIKAQRISIPLTSTWEGHGPQEVTFGQYTWNAADFAAFLGAYLAEGHLRRQPGYYKRAGEWVRRPEDQVVKQIVISQQETSKGYEAYRQLLTRMLGREPGYNHGGFYFACAELWDYLNELGHADEKYIPADVKDWSGAAVQSLLDQYLLGDGYLENGSWRAKTVSKQLAGDLQEVAQKLGMSATLTVQHPKDVFIKGRLIKAENCRDVYLVRFSKSLTRRTAITRSHYNGKVYCVSVPNGILYVRQNGSPVWCGNSQDIQERKALKPDLLWLKNAIFDRIIQDVCGQMDMEWKWDGLEEDEDEQTLTTLLVAQIGAGLASIDEARIEMGRQPWGLPITSDPGWAGQMGFTPLGQISPAGAPEPGVAPPQLPQPGQSPGGPQPPQNQNQPQKPAASGPPPQASTPMARVPAAGAAPQQASASPAHAASAAAQSVAREYPVPKVAAGTQDAAGMAAPVCILDSGPPANGYYKAACSELEALRRHLHKGRQISTWECRHIPGALAASLSEDLAKGLSADQAVDVAVAMLPKIATGTLLKAGS